MSSAPGIFQFSDKPSDRVARHTFFHPTADQFVRVKEGA